MLEKLYNAQASHFNVAKFVMICASKHSPISGAEAIEGHISSDGVSSGL